MTMELLDKSELTIISKVLKYPLMTVEKDYFLAMVSKIIYDSPLKNRLVFKGGTALHHVYLPQLRFSEDLDFSSNQDHITLEEVKAIFSPYEFLTIKKEYTSNATIKIERLLFHGPLGQANSLKIEIDFLQNVVLPPIEKDYHNEFGIKTKVRVMDIREITAEKIRAMNDRVRYRDFFDFAMICLKLKINLEEVLKLVQKKEIRKPINKQNIMSNWRSAQEDKTNENLAIHCTEELSDEQIKTQLEQLKF